MTRAEIKRRLDGIEAALCPPVEIVLVGFPDDPIPPELEGVQIICLRWPEELTGGDLGASSPLGIPKAG